MRHSANGNQTIVRCERLHRDRVDGDTRCVSDGTDRAVGSAHAGNSTDKGSVRKKGNDHEEPHPQDPPPAPQLGLRGEPKMPRTWCVKSEPTEQTEERSDEAEERSDEKAECFGRTWG